MDSLKSIHRALFRSGYTRTDEELLGLFIAHQDQAAFAELVRRHGPMVLRVCRRVLQHAQDAEDAFQATFIVLARKAATVKLLPNWLYGVAQRVASKARLTAARRRSREQPRSATGLDLPSGAETHAAPDWKRLLDDELTRLPDKYRAAVVLCYLEGKSHAEAARLLACEIDAVRKRLSRAREFLKARLAQRGVVLSAGTLAAFLAHEAVASGAIRASLVRPLHHAASLLVEGGHVPGISANAKALAASVLAGLAWARIKQAATAAALVAIFGLAVITTTLLAPRMPAPVAPPMAARETAADDNVLGEVHDFAKVWAVAAGNGNPANNTYVYYLASGVALGVPNTGTVTMYRHLANDNMQVIQQSDTATITVGPRTATTQQVTITSPGNMGIVNRATNQILGKRVPVQMTTVITLTATPVPGYPTYRACTMSSKAINAGQQVYGTGLLKGDSVAHDQRWCATAPVAAAQAKLWSSLTRLN